MQQRPKKPVPRNSTGAANSRGTAREVPAPWVGPSSKATWGGLKGPLGLGRGTIRQGRSRSLRPCPPAAAGRSAENQNSVVASAGAASLRPVGGSPPLGRMRTWDAPGNPHSPASTRSSKNKASGGGNGRARPARGRAHAVLRARAPPASPTGQPGKGARLPAPGAPCQVLDTHKARKFPFPTGRRFEKTQVGVRAAARAGTGGCALRGRLKTFLLGG